MVFLIQNAQNKNSLALWIKLNELIASSEFSSSSIVNIEDITEEEMKIIQKYYRHLSDLSKKDKTLKMSYSIDEANEKHQFKTKKVKVTPKEKRLDKLKIKANPKLVIKRI